MFPYTMLATTTIFYSNDWPKRFLLTSKILNEKKDSNDSFYISKLSDHCIYEKQAEDNQTADIQLEQVKKKTKSKSFSFYHKFFTLFTFIYIGEQCFLPYSHFITQVSSFQDLKN